MNDPITAQSIALASLKVVRTIPGDVLVLTFAEKLAPRQWQDWADALETVFPDYEGLILDGGADLSVLRTEQPERPKVRPFPRRKVA